jgi:hypothetical protein
MEDEMARNSLLLDQAVESGEKKKSRKKLIVGLAMLGVIPVVGSTLAASISLNGGSNIEFGQGNQAVVACDSNITITPTSTFTTSNFYLQKVKVSNVATGCEGKTFTVVARDSSGTALTGGTIGFTLAASGSAVTNPSGASAVNSEYTATGMEFTLTSTTVPAADVARFTLESN